MYRTIANKGRSILEGASLRFQGKTYFLCLFLCDNLEEKWFLNSFCGLYWRDYGTYLALLHLAQYHDIRSSVSPGLMDQRGLRVTHIKYFSLLTHTKQLLLVTFCDKSAGIWVSFLTHGNIERQKINLEGWTDRREGWNSYLDLLS